MPQLKGDNADVNVKRLPKRPMPPRFGRKLTATQRELATHICIDCGWIYFQKTPFDELSEDFQCPQCSAYKKRFAPYDASTGKVHSSAASSSCRLKTMPWQPRIGQGCGAAAAAAVIK